ncbi:MAG: NUDIX domain-containing protein [Alphaproteobacteria bacterium]|jgi:8-oxo-dGTP pyrophosphatase MutT (NUDIX family)|nr:NUDIX domain-containing protein [Alphaproteobacteria bacterium]|tara:strand:+ start:271 stop:876 length:606 start_codon:yes stop_codon:yes gene_type:complete
MVKVIKPKPAATLVITKVKNKKVHVLMGKRPNKARFAPGMWVFPGGKLDKSDLTISKNYITNNKIIKNLSLLKAIPPLGKGLIHTAIRETEEETNLKLKSNNIKNMWVLGRAITPLTRPMRFDTKFFVAPSDCFIGKVKGNGELAKLEYVEINKALNLPMFDVTEFILQEINKRINKGNEVNSNPVFWRYRKHHRLITEIK